MPFGPTHNLIRSISNFGLESFFSSIESVNSDQVPRSGPIIVASNHWNMIIDPALLSTRIGFRRKLHYWSKNTLFNNPIAKFILIDSGNIPVDRTNKNNQLLFKGTFDVLKLGECIALFPEGTSYTQPKIVQIKDGIAWTALEYAKNLRLTGSKLSGEITSDGQNESKRLAEDVKIVIVGINYTEKTSYRSSVQLEYAETINLEDELIREFLSEGDEKVSVKRLIRVIESRLRSVTINSDDWESIWCAEIVREIIWDDGIGPLHRYRENMQRLIDVFSMKDNSKIMRLRSNLINYHNLLKELGSSHQIFKITIPDRDQAYKRKLIEILRSLMFWTFFYLPFLLHLPIYFASYLGSLLQPKEIESTAQNKLISALIMSLIILPIYTMILSSRLLTISSKSKNFKPIDRLKTLKGQESLTMIREIPEIVHRSSLSSKIFSITISLIILFIIHMIHNSMVDKCFECLERLKFLYKLDYFERNFIRSKTFKNNNNNNDDDDKNLRSKEEFQNENIDDDDNDEVDEERKKELRKRRRTKVEKEKEKRMMIMRFEEDLWNHRKSCEDGWSELVYRSFKIFENESSSEKGKIEKTSKEFEEEEKDKDKKEEEEEEDDDDKSFKVIKEKLGVVLFNDNHHHRNKKFGLL